MVWNERREISHSLRADSIRRECEASLRRLKVDAIDLYQIHWPDPDAEIEEGWTAMAALKEEGKVRNVGVSNFSVAQMKRAQAAAIVGARRPDQVRGLSGAANLRLSPGELAAIEAGSAAHAAV